MRHCNKCKKSELDNSLFCSNCGTQLIKITNDNFRSKLKKRFRKKKTWIVILLLLTTFFFFNPENSPHILTNVSAYNVYQDDAVTSDSDIDAIINIGTDGATSFTDAQTINAVDQIITEGNGAGYVVGTDEDEIHDNIASNHAPADFGTYSSDANMQQDNNVYNTLTEEDSGGGGGGGGNVDGDAISIFGATGVTTPRENYFEGSTQAWQTSGVIDDIGSDLAWVVGLGSPKNVSEILFATQDHTPSIYSWLYNNITDTFSSLGQQATGLLQCKAGQDCLEVDVSYEHSSGDRIIVYQDSTTALKYRTMAFGVYAWSVEATVPETCAFTPFNIALSFDPDTTSDEIALTFECVDSGTSGAQSLYGLIWSGTAWGNEKVITTDLMAGADPSAGKSFGRPWHMAYEGLTGQLMVWYYDYSTTSAFYIFWSGIVWDVSSTAYVGEPSFSASKGGWVEMAGKTTTDGLILSIVDSTARLVYMDVWTGSAWDGAGTMNQDGDSEGKGRSVDVEWTGTTAMVVWTARNVQGVYYATWTSGGGWVAGVQLPSSPAVTRIGTASMGKNQATDELLVSFGDQRNSDTYLNWYWSGSIWTKETDDAYSISGLGKENSHLPIFFDGTNGGGATNYEFDREFSFTSIATTDGDTETLAINTGTMGTESLLVQIWEVSAWVTVVTLVDANDNVWINTSIATWMDSATEDFRFLGGTETSDTTQNTWDIDMVLIHNVKNEILDYELQWEHQAGTVDKDKDSYRLSIFGSATENMEIQTWNIGGSSWNTALTTQISSTEQWYNQTFDANAIDTSGIVTWRYRGTAETGDTSQSTLNIDYAGIAGWNFTINIVELTFEIADYKQGTGNQSITPQPLQINVSSGISYTIQVLGTDTGGTPVASGYIYYDTDSNPVGATLLTTGYVSFVVGNAAGDGIITSIYIWLDVPFGVNDGLLTMTLSVQIIAA